jgi:anti-sigma factor RsiW
MTVEQHPSDVVLLGLAAGTLDETERVEFASHVRGCESCHAFVRLMEHVDGIILDDLPPTSLADGSLATVIARLDKGANGGPSYAEPVPPSVGGSIQRKTQVNLPPRYWALQAAAAAIFLALGATGGWFAKEWSAAAFGPETQNGLIARALDAYVVYAPDLRHPVEVVAAERDHLNTWLSRRIQHQIAAPDLTNAGYSLLGGRLLSDRGKPAALFMYQDAAGNRLTVLVAQSEKPGEDGTKQIVREDLKAISWSDGPLTLSVTGKIDTDRLREISEIVRQSVKG